MPDPKDNILTLIIRFAALMVAVHRVVEDIRIEAETEQSKGMLVDGQGNLIDAV